MNIVLYFVLELIVLDVRTRKLVRTYQNNLFQTKIWNDIQIITCNIQTLRLYLLKMHKYFEINCQFTGIISGQWENRH